MEAMQRELTVVEALEVEFSSQSIMKIKSLQSHKPLEVFMKTENRHKPRLSVLWGLFT